MINPIQSAKQEIQALIHAAALAAHQAGQLPHLLTQAYTIDIPADKQHGDFAVNAAMQHAKTMRMAPRKIAEILVERLDLSSSYFDKVEIAGPGFINFYTGQKWLADVIAAVFAAADRYGRTDLGKDKKVMVEFVSANPTGPMHMGNARGGALGDCLASCLDWAGYQVTREFYINDAGNQIEKFVNSLEARYQQYLHGEDAVPFPEDGYHGDDIKQRVEEFIRQTKGAYHDAPPEKRQQALLDYALEKNISLMKEDLARYRIHYDVWFRESSLYASGELEQTIALLKEKGYTYEKDGALWYKASSFGAPKDEVLVRANGFPTYFAADIAYHRNKFAVRQFDRVINVWGADHHGHVARMQKALDAIGLDGSKLDVVLMQLVRLMREGEVVRMSKRTGKSIALKDLLEEISVDAARFFFNLRQPGSQMDFDLSLAAKQSSDNPVYYVQYAYVRICSILRKMADQGVVLASLDDVDLSLLVSEAEIDLIKWIAAFPEQINAAAEHYDPARITRYVIDLATLFHKFYTVDRIQTTDPALTRARLALCVSVKTVIANIFTILNISAPEQM